MHILSQTHKFLVGLVLTIIIGLLGYFSTTSQEAEAQQSKVQITGSLTVKDAQLIRFVDTENKVTCYMNNFTGALSCVK